MLDDEVRTILRELLTASNGGAAAIEPASPDDLLVRDPDDAAGPDGDGDGDGDRAPGPELVPQPGRRWAALGNGARLRLEVGETAPHPDDLAAALERTVRALRAAARRWGLPLPALRVSLGPANPSDRVRARVDELLAALASVQHATNAVVVRGGAALASARPLDELAETRWPFLSRRALAAADRARGSSHAELVDTDAYALTFWYGAVLLLFFTAPYGVDFVRHRARLVTRELTQLLPLLEPPPAAPAGILPRPD